MNADMFKPYMRVQIEPKNIKVQETRQSATKLQVNFPVYLVDKIFFSLLVSYGK